MSKKQNRISSSKVSLYIFLLLLVTFIIWLVVKPKSEKPKEVFLEGVEELGQEVEIMGRDHINVGSSHDEYNSNPPTSGPHYAMAPNPGFYKKGLEDESAVHGLEHGYIWITYHPEMVTEEIIDSLKSIQRKNLGSVMLSPRTLNESPIILASWGRFLAMEELDEATINTYIKLHKNQSPEPFAR